MTQFSVNRMIAIAAACLLLANNFVSAQEESFPETSPEIFQESFPETTLSTQGPVEDQQAGLTTFLATKVFLLNNCQIELGRIAEELSYNKDVKEFAGMLQQDHRKINQLLQGMVPAEFATQIAQQAFSEESDNDQANLVDATENADQEGEAERTVVGRANYDQMIDPVVLQICKLEKQTAKNRFNVITGMLKECEGFDKGFMTMQIQSHAIMLAELKSVKDVGTPEFQRIAAQMTKSMTSHLERAREIASDIQDDSNANEENEDDFSNEGLDNDDM